MCLKGLGCRGGGLARLELNSVFKPWTRSMRQIETSEGENQWTAMRGEVSR